MIGIKKIFPECNADTLLVELILECEFATHIHGINNVGLAIDRHYRDAYIVGVVDKDKCRNNDPRIKLYTKLVDGEAKNYGIEVLKEPGTEKHLIYVAPAFEKFIWNLAEITGNIGLEGFNSFEDVKTATKNNRVNHHKKLRRFINAIIKANPPAIQTMRKWLEKAV